MLCIDNKNYHLWTYRIWIARHFKIFEEEKIRILKWLDQDVMNNSAWAYRQFLLRETNMSIE